MKAGRSEVDVKSSPRSSLIPHHHSHAMSSAPSSSRATLVNVLSDSSLPDQVLDVAAFLSRSKPEAERSDYINSWSSKATAAAEDSSKADAVVEELCGEFKGLGEGLDRGGCARKRELASTSN